MSETTTSATRAPSARHLPMTAAQERLWFLQLLDPDDTSYHMAYVQRLRGPLDVAALRASLDAVVARHEPLRTRFPAGADGRAYQEIRPPSAVPVAVVDVSGTGDPEAFAVEAAADLVNRPFDLAAGAPFGAFLIRVADGDHVFGIALHHLIADGWSLAVLSGELADGFRAARAGARPATDPPDPAWHDYVAWQAERLADGRAAALTAHWADRVRDAPALDLPTDFPRPAVRTGVGGWHHATLDETVTARVRALARAERATPFMVLVAAYMAVLARHTGQDDICVGTPIAGRERAEWEPLVGYFTNTVVLRGDVSGRPSFRELLRRVRGTALDAYAHQDLPFEALMAALDMPRDLGRTPLFQTMFILQSAGAVDRPGAWGDLTLVPFEAELRAAKFDLLVEAIDDGPTMRLRLDYAAELFTPATAAALADRYTELLRADPDAPLDTVDMLTEADRRRLEREAGDGAPAGAPDVVDAIRRAAGATPSAPALAFDGEVLSYADLDRRGDEAARFLRAAGIGVGDVVAVCLPRGLDLVVALLAVWKAGAAYLPLERALPPARLSAMTRDAGASIALVDDVTAALLAGAGVDCVTDWAAPADAARAGHARDADDVGHDGAPVVDVAVRPADLAYVLYTSGSTGTPKGVAITRGAVAARVASMIDIYGLTPADRVLQLASVNFDTHVEEIFPALAVGATVELMPGPAAMLPDFLATPAGRAVTVLDLATALWHQLVAYQPADAWPPALRLVILGGDQVQPPALDAWHATGPRGVRLVNTYGPTEATVIASHADLVPGDTAARPPIGRPLDATVLRVLDAGQRALPPGAPGELCIGGAGLARGYVGRPGETAARFVPDPFGPPGARLYRTGDRARWRPDGRLEFLGRIDRQVKVRGSRVEPGEVEAVLAAHPSVGAVAVVVRDGTLIGYVTEAAPIAALDPADLHAHVAARLPEFMRPAAYVVLDTLPLTVNGKVDEAALPPPVYAKAETVPPATDAELLVADVWAGVLGIAGFGVHDDFFALGGNSLHLVAVAARLRAAVDVDVPVRVLFGERTVARLAVAVETALAADLALLSDDEVARLLAESGTP